MSTTTAFPVATGTPLAASEHAALVARMKAIVGNDNVLTAAADMAAYECDGFTIAKTKPNVVVFPTTTEHVVGIVKTCNELGINFIARGAGTSLAGGCVLVGGGVMIAMARMKRILDVNTRDRYAVVEPGVVNVWLTNALKPLGFHYAPDPSSWGQLRAPNAPEKLPLLAKVAKAYHMTVHKLEGDTRYHVAVEENGKIADVYGSTGKRPAKRG